MRIGVVARPDDEARIAVVRKVLAHLSGRAEVVLEDVLASTLGKKGEVLSAMRVDAIVAVGGDGTILITMQQNPAPVLGVKMGTLGFLTEVEPPLLPEALDRLLLGRFALDERMKLEVRLRDRTFPFALNEAVVKSSRTAKMIRFTIEVGGHPVDRLRADGVIVATPTGSTSYAMSAGGPILDPHMEAMLVVPLAAFKLSARPMVFPRERPLVVELAPDTKDAVLVLDGQHESAVAPGDRIEFRAAKERGRFVRLSDAYLARAKERLL
ncbi:MAG: NAD(+)/NADH kinase [Methanobacteriota archaeon]